MAERCQNCWHAMGLHDAARCTWPGCECGGPPLRPALFTVVVMAIHARPEVARGCIATLAPQVDAFVIIDNNDEPDSTIALAAPEHPVTVLHRPGLPNLSAFYNEGTGLADGIARASAAEGLWNVVVSNDDVTYPDGWAAGAEAALRSGPAALAYTDRLGRASPVLMTEPPASPSDFATLWAAMFKGETGVRWDERLRWWYSDNLVDNECRLEHGGTVAVPGPMPNHLHPSQQTFASVELSRLAHEDGAIYNAIVHERWPHRF